MKGFPDYLSISASALGQGQPVKLKVAGDAAALACHLAEAMLTEILAGEASGRGATLIVPVGPVDHYPILARQLNERRVSCRRSVFINMDEYLTDDGRWLSAEHPLSFRGFMDRAFFGLLDPALAPPPEHQVFPDPQRPGAIPGLIAARGGVDACFGGIGINGHIAFNEPPEPGERVSDEEFAGVYPGTAGIFSLSSPKGGEGRGEEGKNLQARFPSPQPSPRSGGEREMAAAAAICAQFAALPTRVLNLSHETRTINSVTVGGEISVIPRRAVTVGMKEILGSKRLRFYCNRPWQRAVLRRALHGPLTAACPASFLRTHADAAVTITDEVAAPPEIKLR